MKNHFNLFCLLLFIASCKYEDGPLFSLSSPEKRVEGYYNIESVEENGVDQMARVDTLNITCFHFGGPAGSLFPNYNAFDIRIADTITYLSFWFFVDESDEKELVAEPFGCGWPPYTPPPFQPLPGYQGSCTDGPSIWTITKLSQKKIWLEADYNNNHYEVHLKQFKSVQ